MKNGFLEAIKKLKKWKATGLVVIENEVWKYKTRRYGTRIGMSV